MSRFGVKHLLITRLHYIDGYAFTSALYLISSKCRGLVYIKCAGYYEEHYSQATIFVNNDNVLISIYRDNVRIRYTSNNIAIRDDRYSYFWIDHVFNAYKRILEAVRAVMCENEWTLHNNTILHFRLSEPNDLWISIQELIRWCRTEPILIDLLKD